MLIALPPISEPGGRCLPAKPKLYLGLNRLIELSHVRIIGVWIERSRQRHALACLDDRMLQDVGINRSDAAREAARPFWRK